MWLWSSRSWVSRATVDLLLLHGAIAGQWPPTPLIMGAVILLLWTVSQGIAPLLESPGKAAQRSWLEQKVSSQRLQKVEVVGARLLGYGKFTPWQQQILWQDLPPEDRMQVTPNGVTLERRSPLPLWAFGLLVGATVGILVILIGNGWRMAGLLGLWLLRQGVLGWAPPWLSLGCIAPMAWSSTWLLGTGEAGLLWGAGFLLLSADGWSLLVPPKRLPLIVHGARLAVMTLAVVIRPELLAIALTGVLLPTQPSWQRPPAPLSVGQELGLWSLMVLSLLIVIPVPKLFPLLLNL